MNIATVLFTYNRPLHTQRVLDALAKNLQKPSLLYIFQDGMEESTDFRDWKAVSNIINSVDWCRTRVVISPENKGLAESVVTGMNFVFRENDAAIVLEDDCVTHPQFMDYMCQALEKYKDNKDVWNINAYAENIPVHSNGTDAYFIGRSYSWGWATWKDRWQHYSIDYRVIARFRKDAEMNEYFSFWAGDVENYILGNVTGRCNSWASFWTTSIIEHKGFCLAPYRGFVENIGFDGSGTHCGKESSGTVIQNVRPSDCTAPILLPDDIRFPDDWETSFYGRYRRIPVETKLRFYNKVLLQFLRIGDMTKIFKYLFCRGISKIAIWGRGEVSKLLLDVLAKDRNVSVLAVIETCPRISEYEGIPVVRPSDIPSETQLLICIPAYDMDDIRRMLVGPFDFKMIGVDEFLDLVVE